MNSFFKKSVELHMKIEKFLDTISNSLELFDKAVQAFLNKECEDFKTLKQRICDLESEADALEIEIKVSLYKFMLLPDARADVLSLVKSLDNIIDATEAITKDILIQKPAYPEDYHQAILSLTKSAIQSADSILLATRAFFSEVHLVSAHVNKVKFHEHETDIAEDNLNDKIFNDGIVSDLALKMQLKRFVSKIAGIADEAEIIADKLTIFTIKREI